MGFICICNVASASTGYDDTDASGICNGIISVFHEPTLLLEVQNSQQQYTKAWYQWLIDLTNNGDPLVQLSDIIICKIIHDAFCLVDPHNGMLVLVILKELHGSAFGGHLGKSKLLKTV